MILEYKICVKKCKALRDNQIKKKNVTKSTPWTNWMLIFGTASHIQLVGGWEFGSIRLLSQEIQTRLQSSKQNSAGTKMKLFFTIQLSVLPA